MSGEHASTVWLANLLAEHGQALVLYARTWCACPEDVVQEAFVELFAQGRAPDHVGPWLYRVVRNRAISAGRQQRRRTQREQRVAASEVWFDGAASRLSALEATEALDTLDISLREVAVARIWGELTFAEIAQLANISLTTAHRWYEQGLRELQQKLEKPCGTIDTPKTP